MSIEKLVYLRDRANYLLDQASTGKSVKMRTLSLVVGLINVLLDEKMRNADKEKEYPRDRQMKEIKYIYFPLDKNGGIIYSRPCIFPEHAAKFSYDERTVVPYEIIWCVTP